jgi:ribosomal protein S18 acetylase RimI-like enzyme
MAVTIRQATHGDAAALADLAAVTFPLACPPGSSPEDMAAFISDKLGENSFNAYLSDPRRRVFVAEDALPGGGARLVAYSLLVDVPPSDADVAAVVSDPSAVELSKCYAHPDCHGTGTSAQLMAESLAWARSQGAAQVWLGVNNENARARKFYEKHGFAVAGEKSFQLGNKVEHDFVMVRPA